MTRKRKNIWSNGFEAWSYVILFSITIVIPVCITITQGGLLLHVSILFNTMVIIRDYLIWITYKPRTRGYLKKCVTGLTTSIISAMYNISQIFCIASIDGYERIVVLDIISVILLCIPIFIALSEGLAYAKAGFNDTK